MVSLGPRIKQLRQHAGLNKAALARKVGVSDVTVSYWESGAIKQIGHERLVALAEALQCSLSQLLTGSGESSNGHPNSADTPPSAPLLLRHAPPAPWLSMDSEAARLTEGPLPASNGDRGYLVTPAPGERFDFLGAGELAAIRPVEQAEQPGCYLIEAQGRLSVAFLEPGADGQLQCRGEGADHGETQPLMAPHRVLGRLLTRWRPEAL